MWIKSEESLINLDNISMIQIEEHEGKYMVVVYDTGATTATPIGEYEDREKAVDKVDEILLGIQNCDYYVYFMEDEDGKS